jgi:hypothetical protein
MPFVHAWGNRNRHQISGIAVALVKGWNGRTIIDRLQIAIGKQSLTASTIEWTKIEWTFDVGITAGRDRGGEVRSPRSDYHGIDVSAA